MASRTRTHCPNCNTQYEPRARKCQQCGRSRDQLSDAEIEARNVKVAQPPKAPPVIQNRGNVAAPINADKKRVPVALYIVGAAVFIIVLIVSSVANSISRSRMPTPAPSATPAPAATPSAKEVAAQRAHDDFMDKKARKEAAEARAYSEQQQDAAKVNALLADRQQQWQQQGQPQQPQGEVSGGFTEGVDTGTHVGKRGGVYHYSSSGKKVYKKNH